MERKLAFYYFVVLFFTSNLCLELAEVETSDERSLSASAVPNISMNLEEVQASMEESSEDDVAPIEPSLSDMFTNKADSNNDEQDILEINCTSSTSVDSSVLIQPDDLQLEISTVLPTKPLEIQPELFTPEIDIPEDLPPVETKEPEELQEEVTETMKEIVENTTTVISENESSIAPEKVEMNISTKSPEDIPSFSEWAQKRLEEVEKNEQVNASLKGSPVNGKAQSAKLRWKNYASLDCGAKVVAANPEAVSPGSVLSPSTDEYKLNKCTSRIWFVVELCEAIQIKKIDLANYELFSSSPKDFTVSVSDRYPTRDWSFVGKFVAKDERTIQSFDLDTHLFGKYVKIEVKSHYGAEHYCPISLFRAFGTSVFEVLQKEDPAHKNRPDDDDDDDGDDEDAFVPPGDPQKNIFNSATDAVISMVKRAAEALGNKVNNGTGDRDNSTSLQSKCFTPRHLVVCNDCNSTLFGGLYELLSCHRGFIGWLSQLPMVYDALLHSNACRKYKLNAEERESDATSYFRNVSAVLPEKYVGAICNEMSIAWNQGELNLTQQYLNLTKKLSNEKIINLEVEKEGVKKLNESVPEGFETVEPASDAESAAISDQDVNTESEEGSKDEESIEAPSSPVDGDNVTETVTESLAVANVSVEILENLEEDMVFTTNSPQPPKESIFIRLSSRIRDLETNMSLSSQYLEELSKRYKKQVEDAQHMYDKTIQTFREDSLRRDEAMRHLEERIRNLTDSVESLMAERQFFYSVVYLTFPGVLVYFLVRFFCGRSSRPAPARPPVKILRRRSVDVLTRQRKQQQRRLSDQTVKYEEKNKRPTKRKRKKPIVRSDSRDWVTDEGRIEDCPFALEENDLCALEALPSVIDDDVGRRTQEAEEEKRERDVVVIVDVKRPIDFPQKSVDRLSKEVNEVGVGNGVGGVKKEKKGFKRLLKKVF